MVVAAVVVAAAGGGLGRLMKVPRLRAAAAVADVVIGGGEGTCEETFPADLRRLSIDVIPRPDVGLLLLLFVIKAAGTPGRRLGLCEICDGGR